MSYLYTYISSTDSQSLNCFSTIGNFDIDYFRDVTRDSDIMNRTAVFEFQLGPVVSLRQSLSYDGSLTWKQVNGNKSGVIHALKSTSYCSYPGESYGQIEKVAGNTYRLSVPLILIGEGRLQVKLNIRLFCSRRSYPRYTTNGYTCTCLEWTVRGSSEYLEMSAKKGWYTI